MNNDVFEKYSIPKAVVLMALPTILGMLVTVFYNIADTYFIGQTGDKLQVAAVSLCAPIFTLLTAFGTIWGVGGSSYISRLLGEKNSEKIKQVSSFCFYASIFSGLIVAVVVLLNMDAVLRLIGCDPETYGYAKTYLTYNCLYGGIFRRSLLYGKCHPQRRGGRFCNARHDFRNDCQSYFRPDFDFMGRAWR